MNQEYSIYFSKKSKRNPKTTICFWLTSFDNRDDWQKEIRNLMSKLGNNDHPVRVEYKTKGKEHQAILHIGD